MILINRVRITVSLAIATLTSLIDLCFPEIIPGTTEFLVKKIGLIIYNNGFSNSSEICEQVSASTGESCAMVETSSGESEQHDEQKGEHSGGDELESTRCKDD